MKAVMAVYLLWPFLSHLQFKREQGIQVKQFKKKKKKPN